MLCLPFLEKHVVEGKEKGLDQLVTPEDLLVRPADCILCWELGSPRFCNMQRDCFCVSLRVPLFSCKGFVSMMLCLGALCATVGDKEVDISRDLKDT